MEESSHVIDETDNNTRNLRKKTSRGNYKCLPESFIANESIGIKNGRWKLEEHTNFVNGILKYGNDWKPIVKLIGTRNCVQARSHNQKFFFKLESMFPEVDFSDFNMKKILIRTLNTSIEDLELLKEFLIKAHLKMEMEENLKKENSDFFEKNEIEIFKNFIEGKNLIIVPKIEKKYTNKIKIDKSFTNLTVDQKIVDNNINKQENNINFSPPKSFSEGRSAFTRHNEIPILKKKKITPTKKEISPNKDAFINPFNNFQLLPYPYYISNNFSFPFVSNINDLIYLSQKDDELLKLKMSQFSNEQGDVHETNPIMGFFNQMMNKLRTENPIELLYNKLNRYQDEVCMKNLFQEED